MASSSWGGWAASAGVVLVAALASADAQAQNCVHNISSRQAPTFQDYKKTFQGSIALVLNPSLAEKSRLNVVSSGNFVDVSDDCLAISRKLLFKSKTTRLHFVLNNEFPSVPPISSIVRSFTIVQIIIEYKVSGASRFQVYRNAMEDGTAVWQRDGESLGLVPPIWVRETFDEWNLNNTWQGKLADSDKALGLKWHGVPIRGNGSTWDFRTELSLAPSANKRTVINLMIAFQPNSDANNSSAIPFNFKVFGTDKVTAITINCVSELGELGFSTILQVIDP